MTKNLFRDRLINILDQLSFEQGAELLGEHKSKPFKDITDAEVKTIHDKFINLQFSMQPYLDNKDIRHVMIYPYKD